MSDLEIEQNLQKLKVPELKKLLKERGLSTTGNKPELILRLETEGDLGDATLDDEEILAGEVDEDVEDEIEDVTEEDLLTEKENEENSIEETPVTQSSSSNEDEKEEKVVSSEPKFIKVSAKTASERLASRAERFGVVSETGKKESRAARFGLPAKSDESSTDKKTTKAAPLSTASSVDIEKLKKRAERFGGSVSATYSQVEGVDKMKKRAERFGQGAGDTSSKTEDNAQILKRKERFGAVVGKDSSSEQDKKKLRAERFNLSK